jgi:hypothetical protein
MGRIGRLAYSLAIWMLLAFGLSAQSPQGRTGPAMMPTGIIRGHLLAILGGTSGIAEVQRDDGSTYDCDYDSHTLFERNKWPIHAEDLNAGEPVEVLSDRRPGTRTCYVRVLSVVYRMPPPARRPTKIAPLEGDTEEPAPAPVVPVRAQRGYLSYSGVVTQYDRATLTLHTRSGEEVLRLRADTLYSNDGVRIATPENLINRHVFIRAGRSLYGGLEAYQVMWGEIVIAH